MAILAKRCPVCGNQTDIIGVASYPPPGYNAVNRGERPYSLATITPHGICCSFSDRGHFATREEADKAAAGFDSEAIAILDNEKAEEAAMYDDDYFFDRGPADSYPYD